MNPSFMAEEISSNVQGSIIMYIYCVYIHVPDVRLSCNIRSMFLWYAGTSAIIVVGFFAAIKEILGVIIPRMKDFHNLLVSPPNVSLSLHHNT